jgi:uncharacterized membrane protein YdjX (TVP38/TMEM64 family)
MAGQVQSIVILAILFTVSGYGMYHVFLNFPTLREEELAQLNPPSLQLSDPVKSFSAIYSWIRDLENVKRLGVVLTNYSETHYYHIMGVFVASYTFLQSFAIPGSSSLSLLGGALFGFYVGMLLVCTCSSIGALNCYFLSSLVGSPLINRYQNSPRLVYLRDTVKTQKNSLLSFILFLRITPLLPNWFINITSPHVGIPPFFFFIGTFFGVIPLSFIPVNAGLALQSLKSFDDFSIWNLRTMSLIFATAFAALLPALTIRMGGKKYADPQKKQS